MKLLHIDSSILGAHSVSRILTASIVAKQRSLHPDLEVVYRDLAVEPFQHLSAAHLAATPNAGLDLASGVAALNEILATDILVIGAPMYNFGIPSQLKAWIDRLAVAGTTFRYTENGPEGLVKGKKVFVASSRGGAYADTPIAFLDHQEAYLAAILGFLGMTGIQFIRAENVARPDLRDPSIQAAETQIAAIAA